MQLCCIERRCKEFNRCMYTSGVRDWASLHPIPLFCSFAAQPDTPSEWNGVEVVHRRCKEAKRDGGCAAELQKQTKWCGGCAAELQKQTKWCGEAHTTSFIEDVKKMTLVISFTCYMVHRLMCIFISPHAVTSEWERRCLLIRQHNPIPLFFNIEDVTQPCTASFLHFLCSFFTPWHLCTFFFIHRVASFYAA